MDVKVLFFASLKDEVGEDSLTLRLPAPAGLDTLIEVLAERLPEAAMLVLRAENVRVAVNQQLVSPPLSLAAGDEVAFLPPVTGG